MFENKIRLLTPGPTPLPENVRLALALDMIHHRKADFKKIMQQCQQGLRYLFETEQEVLTLTCSGTGAMTAAVGNLFAPGEKVLVVEGGKFGQRWGEIAVSSGLEIITLSVPWGQAVEAQQVQNILEEHKDIRGVLMQASETSTGVLHPVRQIGELTAPKDCLLVVDGISAVGISPCPMDKWQIDCLLTGSQKGLMLPPGLAFMALSKRARAKVKNRTAPCFYFNLAQELDKSSQAQTLFTPAINLIVGLQACLQNFQDQGLDKIFVKQWALTQMTRAGVEALGLTLLAPQNYTWGLTSVSLPEGVDGAQILSTAAEKYGVYLAGGQGHLKNRIIRIGHMGYVDWSDILAGLYALRCSYIAAGGFSGARDYLEIAMQTYEQAKMEKI